MGIIKGIMSFFEDKEEGPAELPGRNELCWCGSGIKYKKCCLEKDDKRLRKKSSCCTKT